MITINLMTSAASLTLLQQAVGQLEQAVQGPASRFQPGELIELAHEARECLLVAGEEALGVSRLFTRFCDLYSDESLTQKRAKDLLRQARTAPLPSLVPGYEHLDPVGFGGFSRVYRGLESATGRLVAIKIAARNRNALQSGSQKPPPLKQLQKAFANEWEILSQFDGSERVVQVYARGTTDRNKPYLVMEYLPGGSLSNFIVALNQGRTDFDLDQVLRMALEATLAVGEFHEKGLIHNDLKAGNFLLTRDREVKLADCSMATTVEEAARNSHKRGYRGTPGFIAVQTKESQKKDVFALGATLYALFTGKQAFPAGSAPISTFLWTPPPPGRVRPERRIPARLGKVIMKALHRAPTERYASALEMARDLEKVTQR